MFRRLAPRYRLEDLSWEFRLGILAQRAISSHLNIADITTAHEPYACSNWIFLKIWCNHPASQPEGRTSTTLPHQPTARTLNLRNVIIPVWRMTLRLTSTATTAHSATASTNALPYWYKPTEGFENLSRIAGCWAIDITVSKRVLPVTQLSSPRKQPSEDRCGSLVH